MKIRNGFVSNSSSASFVLRIDMPIIVVMDKLSKSFWKYDKDAIENWLKSEIAKVQKQIEEYKSKINVEKDTIYDLYLTQA